MLTGSRNQYVLSKNTKSGKYYCSARFDMSNQKWVDHSNSPHDSDQSLWKVSWPKVGGGGSRDLELTGAQLFVRLATWNDNNYLIGAATDGSSDQETTDGVVDNHAYSVIDCRKNVRKTGMDLVLIRNPWGEGGELENGMYLWSLCILEKLWLLNISTNLIHCAVSYRTIHKAWKRMETISSH